MGNHRGDLAGGSAPRGVDHEEQLHEVFLRGRHQGLDDVHVALTAVGKQLRLEAVVRETGDLDSTTPHTEVFTDLIRERLVSRT